MDLKAFYSAVEADYDDVMRRFRSEERVNRFLLMFLKDESFKKLCSAMDEKDYEAAFKAVHTMKGISMNLSLTSLQNSCIELTENLRYGKHDSNTEMYFENTKAIYLKTVSAIQEHLE